MKKFVTQTVMMFLAVILLLKGGMSVFVSAWRLIFPVIALGGAYYFFRKTFQAEPEISGATPRQRKVNYATNGAQEHPSSPFGAQGEKGGVIEICPHCLSEVGSCSKCRK